MGKRVRFSPPSGVFADQRQREWAATLHARLGEGPFLIQGYSVSALPSASTYGSVSGQDTFTAIIFVADEVGGPVLAFSNGTNWLRVTDNSVVA